MIWPPENALRKTETPLAVVTHYRNMPFTGRSGSILEEHVVTTVMLDDVWIRPETVAGGGDNSEWTCADFTFIDCRHEYPSLGEQPPVNLLPGTPDCKGDECGQQNELSLRVSPLFRPRGQGRKVVPGADRVTCLQCPN